MLNTELCKERYNSQCPLCILGDDPSHATDICDIGLQVGWGRAGDSLYRSLKAWAGTNWSRGLVGDVVRGLAARPRGRRCCCGFLHIGCQLRGKGGKPLGNLVTGNFLKWRIFDVGRTQDRGSWLEWEERGQCYLGWGFK